MCLSLPDKLKYVEVEEFNGDVRVLLRVASPLIACADSIQQCLGGAVGTVDMGVCEGVHRESQALLQTLARLAPQQMEALTLVREYRATPTVSTSDIEGAEYDVSYAQLAARKPGLSEEQKRESVLQVRALQQKLSSLQRSKATGERLAEQMMQYLVFPPVASALGVSPTPLEAEGEGKRVEADGETGEAEVGTEV
ncbi:hypothetical protein KIPB_008153 [Kipferlia bialata]|uniref:Uncharacterized protein n=1 Tax=Kipferlia bialata TaxID=797122 RepID=A0A9K3GL30_9EUKA|nr:hypothetical protein KIPB_008153 [Kipferlia bialata]|eukprot:g8153.t1